LGNCVPAQYECSIDGLIRSNDYYKHHVYVQNGTQLPAPYTNADLTSKLYPLAPGWQSGGDYYVDVNPGQSNELKLRLIKVIFVQTNTPICFGYEVSDTPSAPTSTIDPSNCMINSAGGSGGQQWTHIKEVKYNNDTYVTITYK
jgi:hypothetical protein